MAGPLQVVEDYFSSGLIFLQDDKNHIFENGSNATSLRAARVMLCREVKDTFGSCISDISEEDLVIWLSTDSTMPAEDYLSSEFHDVLSLCGKGKQRADMVQDRRIVHRLMAKDALKQLQSLNDFFMSKGVDKNWDYNEKTNSSSTKNQSLALSLDYLISCLDDFGEDLIAIDASHDDILERSSAGCSDPFVDPDGGDDLLFAFEEDDRPVSNSPFRKKSFSNDMKEGEDAMRKNFDAPFAVSSITNSNEGSNQSNQLESSLVDHEEAKGSPSHSSGSAYTFAMFIDEVANGGGEHVKEKAVEPTSDPKDRDVSVDSVEEPEMIRDESDLISVVTDDTSILTGQPEEVPPIDESTIYFRNNTDKEKTKANDAQHDVPVAGLSTPRERGKISAQKIHEGPYLSAASDGKQIEPEPVRSEIGLGLSEHKCAVCQEHIEGKVLRLYCSHYYDPNCLIDMFFMDINDETVFPPRCCGQRIPLTLIQDYLSAELLEELSEKFTEYTTRNRLYCANKRCSRFLGSVLQKAVPKTCKCGTITCGACAETYHQDGVLCRVGDMEDVRQTLIFGQTAGWQRCPGCRQLIERAFGCMHMSCRCGYQFCYLCAARWKTCSCVQREEDLLGNVQPRAGSDYLIQEQDRNGVLSGSLPSEKQRRQPEGSNGRSSRHALKPRNQTVRVQVTVVRTSAANTPTVPRTKLTRQCEHLKGKGKVGKWWKKVLKAF